MVGRRLMLAGVLLLLLAGCAGPVAVTGDDDLTAALIEARDGSEPTRLVDLTDFEWDTVYLFFRYSRGRFINETIGWTVVADDYNSDESNTMIFLANGEVVHAASIGVWLEADRNFVRASSEAWVIPRFAPSATSTPPLCLVERLPDQPDEPLC